MISKFFKKTVKQNNLDLNHMEELSDMEASSVVGGFSVNVSANVEPNDVYEVVNAGDRILVITAGNDTTAAA